MAYACAPAPPNPLTIKPPTDIVKNEMQGLDGDLQQETRNVSLDRNASTQFNKERIRQAKERMNTSVNTRMLNIENSLDDLPENEQNQVAAFVEVVTPAVEEQISWVASDFGAIVAGFKTAYDSVTKVVENVCSAIGTFFNYLF